MTKKKDQKTKERLIEITEEQRRIIIQQMGHLNKLKDRLLEEYEQ